MNQLVYSVGLRKCPYYRHLIEKLTSEQHTFRRACPTKWRKTTDMDKLRHCHPMYWDELKSLASLNECFLLKFAQYRTHKARQTPF